MQPDELMDVALDAATRAGDLLRERFERPPEGVTTKSSPTDLVSDADRDSEALIKRLILERRPDDGLVTEEGDDLAAGSGITWIVDPLDGTVNFLFGFPAWSVSIAARDVAGIAVGVVHDPNRGETFAAARGRGAELNGAPVHVSGAADLSTALVATGFSYDAGARAVQADILRRVIPRVRDVRRMGSAALDLCWVAAGRLDAYYEAPMETWDRAAGELIVAEADGVSSELPAPLGLSPGVIAGNRSLHDDLRALVLDRPG